MTQQASCSSQPHSYEADHENGIGGGVDHIDALTATITRTECVFRSKPATNSGRIRPLIPFQSGRAFRLKSATDSGGKRPPC